MKIKTAQQMMVENTLVKHYAGSISYGTNLPTSDVDFRGVFASDPVNIRTPFFPVREVTDTEEEDTKLFELTHFMKLTIDCNPNVVETLWVHESDIVATSPAYEMLRSNRERLLSTKIAHSTTGYAMSQLKRIKGHNKWINNPQPVEKPQQHDYVTLIQWFGLEKVMPSYFGLGNYNEGHQLVSYGSNTYGLYKNADRSSIRPQDGSLNHNFDGDREDLPDPLAVIKFNKEEWKLACDKWENYWRWKDNRNVSRSALEEQHGYDCYSADTEFLTSSGWKLFDDVTTNDMVATFNPHNHKVEYQTPTERIDSKFSGNMYSFNGHHTNVRVTSNHHMYIREYSRATNITHPAGFCRAAELPETFDTLRRITPRSNRQLLPKGFNREINTKFKMNDYLRLMGWFISDGTLSFYESGVVKDMRISQSKPQSRLTQNLTRQRNLGKLECSHYVYEATGISNYPENVWRFSSDVAKWLYQDCGHGSKHKRIPNWVFFLTKREMTTLLTSLLQGDGSIKTHQSATYGYHTVNYELAGDVQRLALLCGYETSVYRSNTNEMFEVFINKEPKQYKRTTRSQVVKESVVGERIVCFMVPNFTLITRRNGQVGFHGNTKHAMHLVRLLRMGVETLRDGVILVKRPDAQELLDIRNGALTYEEIVSYAESIETQIKELQKTTQLRKKPDIHFAAQLLMDVQDLVWNK
jgi:hypothetical protein